MSGQQQETSQGRFSVAGLREQLLSGSGHKTGWEICWLKLARGKWERGEVGGIPEHETIFSLFMTECLARVDGGGAASWESAGKQGNDQQYQGGGAVSERIVRFDAEELRPEQACDG